VSASERLVRDIGDVMNSLGEGMETAIPTDFHLNAKSTVLPAGDTSAFSEQRMPLIHIEQMFVRSEDDIRKVSQELYNLIEAVQEHKAASRRLKGRGDDCGIYL